jgi:hypothetical protein
VITNTESGARQTFVITFDADGTLDSFELDGLPVDGTYHVAADGSVYMTTYEQVTSSSDPQKTYLNYIDPAGGKHPTSVERAPYFGAVAIDDAGTVYHLTIDGAADRTYVTTISADGVVHQSEALTGRPNSSTALVTAPDGTVYVTTSVNDGAQGQTYVATVDADGNLRVSNALLGFAEGGVVFDGADRAYQSTDRGTHLLDPSRWTAVPAPVLEVSA